MPLHACDASAADFQEKVLDASRRVPVIVDFWAEWCQPCRVLKPILEKLAAEYAGRFLLVKVNSDQNQELAARLGVRGIPAVKAFVDGQMVDEFTGALPEGQVREFIERLIPSPAEPLRRQALEAHERGDLAEAIRLMGEAIKADPHHETAYLDYAELSIEAGALEDARAIIEPFTDRARDKDRIQALQARLKLAAGGAGVDAAVLSATIAENPDDLAARLKLANAQAMGHDYRGALAQLLEIVRRDRHWQDEAGRKTMLTLFSLLAPQPELDDLVREYRIALARILN